MTKRSALGLFALSILVACSAGENPKEPEETSSTAPGRAVEATVVSQNDELGVPSFMWLSGGERPEGGLSTVNAEKVAWTTVRNVAKYFRLSAKGVETVRISGLHDVGHGAIVARFQQRVDNVEVFRAGLNIAMNRELLPVAATGSFSPNIKGKFHNKFKTTVEAAVTKAVTKATGKALALRNVAAANDGNTDGDYRTFEVEVPALGGLTTALASHPRAKKVWFPTATGLVAAFYVEVDRLTREGLDSELVSYVVSADDGKILFEHNMVQNDFAYRVWADPVTLRPTPGPQGHAALPFPQEQINGLAIAFLPPSRVSLSNLPFSQNDPWLAAGATQLTGNNADAYADLIAPDGFNDGDVRVNSTSDGAFDRTYYTDEGPNDNVDGQKAITTHLFYIANYLHDYFYDTGFDEKSGNAQLDNFGRGGKAGDPLKLEAQDFSGRNNANMSTPSDGRSPRMQMYIFDGPSKAKLKLGVSELNASVAQFTDPTFTLTGEAVLAQDGTGMSETDGCEAFTNAAAISGKIAVVDRGNCPFVQKVANATTAGARGVVIVNNSGTTAPGIGASGDTARTIPVLGISLPDGMALKAQLAAATPVSLQMIRDKTIDRDGVLDTGIPAHEWGHYLSNRLVGDANGLTSLQGVGMGEGWADFVALLTLVRPEDANVAANKNWNGVFPAAGYVSSTDVGYYFGIRRMPYSTDVTKNSLTLKHIQDGTPLPATAPLSFGADGASNSEVHNSGEVWANMLWECYASMLRDPKYTFDEANLRMRQYLVASLKLTPNAPTFIEARDAVLAAAYATDAYDFKLFADAFAKRGAGTGAKAPDRAQADNVGVVESFVAGNDFEILAATLDDGVVSCDKDGVLDNGETGTLTIQIRNDGIGTLTQTTGTITASIEGVSFPAGNKISFGPLKPYEVAKTTVQVKLDKAEPMQAFDVTVNMTDPTLAQLRPITATVSTTANLDYKPEASASDDVEAPKTVWTVGGDKSLDESISFTRKADGKNHLWFMRANQEISDQYLVSPALKVGTAAPFVLTMKHRFSFEVNSDKFFDGGVIEVSTDNGTTWADAGESIYTGTLDAGDATIPSSNPLAGRNALVGKSEGYPELTNLTLNFGKSLAGKSVLVRFRVGSDEGTAFVGWELDDIAFTGIDNTPFIKLSPNTCKLSGTGGTPGEDGTGTSIEPTEPGGSIVQKFRADDDGGCNTAPGSTKGSTGAAAWLAGLAAFVLGRRRNKKA